MTFTLTVNKQQHVVDVAADTPLLYILRNDLQLNGPKFGCGLSQCGACTVHLADQAIRSCVTPGCSYATRSCGKQIPVLFGLQPTLGLQSYANSARPFCGTPTDPSS